MQSPESPSHASSVNSKNKRRLHAYRAMERHRACSATCVRPPTKQGGHSSRPALHGTKKKVGSECQNTEVENAFLAGGTVDSHSLPRGRVHVLIFAPLGRKTIIVRHPHIARVFLNFSGDRDVMQKHVSHKASARSHFRTFLNSASRQWRRGNIPQLPSQAPNPRERAPPPRLTILPDDFDSPALFVVLRDLTAKGGLACRARAVSVRAFLGSRISTCLRNQDTDYRLIWLHLLPKGANQSKHMPRASPQEQRA